jgi:tetratricopeptide (TPR) repeat protein
MIEGFKFGEWVWRIVGPVHYRIPETAYVVMAIAIVLTVVSGMLRALPAAAPVLVVAVVGASRWHFDRRAARGGLVIPRFSAPSAVDAREVQRTIVASLYAKLSPDEAKFVRSIAVTVGPDERDFAVRLRRRLRAAFLLYGRIGDDGESVHPSIVVPLSRTILHFDPVTSDLVPAKTTWRSLFTDLASTQGVSRERYPFPFTQELETVVQATAARLAHARGDLPRAERLLRDALAVDPQSRSHQIDGFRAELATIVAEQGRRDEALAVLRWRTKQDDAAPELLRTYAQVLTFPLFPGSRLGLAELQRRRPEAIAVLRKAAADRSDPERDRSRYNLANVLINTDSDANRDEATQIIRELRESSTHYRKAWYVLRVLGVEAWHEYQKAREVGDDSRADVALRAAARLYSRAIRRRPRFRLYLDRGVHGLSFGLVTFAPSPIMHANAHDAHLALGHKWRARWHISKAVKVVNKCLSQGDRAMAAGDWAVARRAYERGIVGWRDDTEVQTRVFASAACLKLGDVENAKRWWREAIAVDRGKAIEASRELAEAGLAVPQ